MRIATCCISHIFTLLKVSSSEIFSFISDPSFPVIFSKPKESSDSEKKPEISGETVFR